MRKEVILAVIIGVLLGGVILYGINLANNSATSNNSTTKSVAEAEITPTPAIKTNDITFITPQDHAVVTDDQITLKGTTKANAHVAIITESDDILTTADANGNFSSLINLISGENTISVTSVDANQATTSASITVIKTTALPQ
jgi:hypothetical protein